VRDDQLRLRAAVLSSDGQQRLAAEATGPATDAMGIGQQVAAELTEAGAAELIADARR
jgi:porphobilinogen deaminase